MKTDILIIGTGCAGLFCALHLPKDKNIYMITKEKAEHSDSFLAQGGMCMLREESDYDSYFEDTMHAGHYENNPESVEIMIRSSRDAVEDLVSYGVEFHRERDGSFSYTREGGHSAKRILFHADITGKEITGKLLEKARRQPNIQIVENCAMLDLICGENACYGAYVRNKEGKLDRIYADITVLACGGIGGLYPHTTNYRHLTGDGIAVALEHGIELEHINYVQIHPTTLYTEETEERSFLISESVRGEGAVLYNANKERFVNELLPRDALTKEIYSQMEKDGKPFVWLSMEHISDEEIRRHFPNIVEHCKSKGYDVFHECIPVVPAQHYFMGGIKVDKFCRTSMERLYAVGETACNGVHGKNRLASNSLLESLVFAKRAAKDLSCRKFNATHWKETGKAPDYSPYQDETRLAETYKKNVLSEIERLNKLCMIQ